MLPLNPNNSKDFNIFKDYLKYIDERQYEYEPRLIYNKNILFTQTATSLLKNETVLNNIWPSC